jgi:alpha-1,2-mannosyltransferase
VSRDRWPLGAVCALLAAEAATFAVLLPIGLHHHVLWLEVVSTMIFLAAMSLLPRVRLSPQRLGALIIGAGALFQLIAVTTPPASSDDDYRYAWDAKVQLSGIEPYRYAPVAPQLEHLRDGFLFPNRSHCNWPIPDGCSAINRPTLHTIHPPVAEAAFVAMRVASFGGRGNHLPLQLAGALGSIAIAWLLYRRRVARDRPLWTVALWAWCPLTVVEFGNGAHIDWLAILLAVLALISQAARRSRLAGVLIGAAIATTVYAVLILPSLVRRHPRAVLGAAVTTVVACYIPHVVFVGTKVLGFLPEYLREQHYTGGRRFLLLDPVLPRAIATAAATVLLVAAAWWVVRHAAPARPEDSAVVMVGLAMLITTPAYGWYAGLLLALIAMSGAVEWLPVALVAGIAYLVDGAFKVSPAVDQLMYAGALVATLVGLLVRWARRQGDGGGMGRPGGVGPGHGYAVTRAVALDRARQAIGGLHGRPADRGDDVAGGDASRRRR